MEELLEQTLISLGEIGFLSAKQKEAVKNIFQLIQEDDITDDVKEKMAACLQTILNVQADGKAYNLKLNRICIKNLLPAVYALNKSKPLENNKYLFMQPRKGLNQSFQYIYNKLEREYDCKLRLHELYRGEVTKIEYYVNAMVFVKDLATAKAVFVHESNNLLGHIFFRPETKVIQLWHGCGVLKKLGLSTAGKKGFKSMSGYTEFPEYNKYSIVTIASPELSWVFEEFMGIEKNTGVIQAVGVSRTDVFFDKAYIENSYNKLYKKIPEAKNKKVILYAPTYRGLDPNRVSPDKLDVEKFAEALGEDYILIFKHHQTAVQVPEIPEKYRDKFAWDMTRGRGMDINELMTVSDICITDYSSVAFEFSLFERPLMFFVYDLEDYIDARGLYYDFNEVTPGPLCKTNEEMIDYIRHIDERFDKQEVIDFKNKFMSACDGYATERIIDFIGAEPEQYAYKVCFAKEDLENDGKLYDSDSPYVIPGNSSVDHRKNKFLGWSVMRTEHEKPYWYCEDGTWRMESEIKSVPFTKKYYFQAGESLSNIQNFYQDSVWNIVPQWYKKEPSELRKKCRQLKRQAASVIKYVLRK